MSGNVLNLHRNKRGIVLDLKRPECRAALDSLIERADVFVHNLRANAIGRLGYDYERVRAINPNIVYCGAYGFGANGPYADKPAYDDLIQAGSGVAALFGQVHGEPAYVPTVICDKLAGQAIAYSIMAALYQVARGGGGQAIEVPMLETTIEFNLAEHMFGSAFEPPLPARVHPPAHALPQTLSHARRLRMHIPYSIRTGRTSTTSPAASNSRPTAIPALVRSCAEHSHPL